MAEEQTGPWRGVSDVECRVRVVCGSGRSDVKRTSPGPGDPTRRVWWSSGAPYWATRERGPRSTEGLGRL